MMKKPANKLFSKCIYTHKKIDQPIDNNLNTVKGEPWPTIVAHQFNHTVRFFVKINQMYDDANTVIKDRSPAS